MSKAAPLELMDVDTNRSVDVPEGRIRAERVDIQLESVPLQRTIPETTSRLKLYNMPNLAQKIQLWLIVILSSGSLLSNLSSIATTFGLLTSSPHNCTFPSQLTWRPP